MSVFGLPIETFAVLVATVLAASSGMIHYVIVYKIIGKEFPKINNSEAE